MDAVTLLTQDHRVVEQLFKRFERIGEDDIDQMREVADQVIYALAKHAVVEEQFLYPALRERGGADGEKMALEALEEHHVAKWLLLELHKLPADDERFRAKMTVLMENIRLHVEEEETELFPKMRKLFDEDELEDLGVLLESAKEVAPTRPHPRSPDTPPGNFLAGALASLLDRGRDLIRGERRAPRQMAAKQSRAPKSRTRKTGGRKRT